MEIQKQHCLACNRELEGRIDKKFCDPYCKSNWHYKKSRNSTAGFYAKVDRQLKTNRRILKRFNKAGKGNISAQTLLDVGFDPKFFTHHWKNNSGNVYQFVYEFGFLTRTENGTKKYILVTWQSYMEK